MKKNIKQPLPKQGESFNGWAIYNWGMPWNLVFRTRKEAKEYCVSNSIKAVSWHDVKDHMAIVKVVCIVQDAPKPLFEKIKKYKDKLIRSVKPI